MTLSGLRTDGGISLETPQRKRASAHVEGRISWFFSSLHSKLEVPLELQRGPQVPALGLQGSPVSSRVPKSPWGFLCSHCRDRDPHLDLRRLETQGSFLGGHGSRGYSGASTGESGSRPE